jgi:PII-like signaling protein
MQIPGKASLLRIFIGEDDRADGRPLYEAIVLKAREAHLAGATVLRGPLGFGRSSVLHTAKILRLSQDLPIVIEIVDTEAKIEAFLPTLTQLTESCLITLEKVTVVRYGEDDSGLDAGDGSPTSLP